MPRKHLLTSAAAGLLTLFAAGASSAQSQDQTTSLEEIVVTGEKADRSLQDTPTSVRGVSMLRNVTRSAAGTGAGATAASCIAQTGVAPPSRAAAIAAGAMRFLIAFPERPGSEGFADAGVPPAPPVGVHAA